MNTPTFNNNYNYSAQRDYSDNSLPQGVILIFQAIGMNPHEWDVVATNFYEDTRQASDLKFTHKRTGRIWKFAYRSRRGTNHLEDYLCDVTFRFKNKRYGCEVEWAKIMKSPNNGDFSLYTFTVDEKIVRWVLLNLHALRTAYFLNARTGGYKTNTCIKSMVKSNKGEFDTDFLVLDTMSITKHDEFLIPEQQIISCYNRGYYKDVITGMKFNGDEHYKLKDKKDRVDNGNIEELVVVQSIPAALEFLKDTYEN